MYFYRNKGSRESHLPRIPILKQCTTMDKLIWLKVIRQELGLLDQLASGMIDDSNLSREEVELALARSKAVVREFEMLLNQMVRKQEEVAAAEVVAAPAKKVEIIEPEPPRQVPPVLKEQKPEPGLPEPVVESIPVRETPTQKAEEPLVQPVAAEVQQPEVNDSNMLTISEQQEHTQFKAAPLKSLKEGLSLNDRYLFQRELFDNDKARLDDTVAALDRLTSIREAVEYLKSNFKWNKSEASEKFVHLVKRRFS